MYWHNLVEIMQTESNDYYVNVHNIMTVALK